MSFLYPHLLWILFPLLLLLWQSHKTITQGVHLIILMLLILSLARPVEKQALQEANIEAKDIIIALDVSFSMKATDLSPTRYDFAKETIGSLLKKSPSDNIMLIAFTSNPLLLSPPTTDHRLIQVALQSLNPEYILTKGTSLKKLFQKLSTMKVSQKHLILMTDGGEEEHLEILSSLLQKSGVSLHILALGTPQGSTVKNKEGKVLKDKEGNLVITRINPLLKNLAYATKGSYTLPSSSAESTAKSLMNALDSKALKKEHILKMQYQYKEWYQLPLFLALILFFMLHTRLLRYLLLLFAFFGVSAHASFFDLYHLKQAYSAYEKGEFHSAQNHLKKIEEPSLQSQLILGNTYYKNREFKQAIKTYTSIQSTSIAIKQMLYYNIANTYVHLQVYDKAKIYYTKVLQLGSDKEARYNLALIALLEEKEGASLGIAHPKSQSSDSSKATSQEKDKKRTREEDQPSSGSGSGGESESKEEKLGSKLISDDSKEKQPLGSKVYDLINKGYIRETQPW